MKTNHNSKRAKQELLVLNAAIQRLHADAEGARAAVVATELTLDSLDDAACNGYGSRSLQAAQDALRSPQEWEAREFHCENRPGRVSTKSEAKLEHLGIRRRCRTARQ